MKKISFKTVFLLLLMIAFSHNPTTAQEDLNVLPLTGRNKLFHTYLMEELDSVENLRKLAVNESLKSYNNLTARQAQLKKDYLRLIGTLPEKTPLNDSVIGTIVKTGYKIDKVYYESCPNHHVTANFYYPTTGSGPYPAILVTCGHYPVAKSVELLQQLCIMLVTHGFAVLIVDPIAQGERVQLVNPTTGKLYYTGQSGTSEISRLDVGAVIAGTSTVAYELWDNYRSLDYLFSRPEVDTNKIGTEGSSGGGAQSTYLDAFDNKIKATAIDSYIMNEQKLFSTYGPQTGSQNLSYESIYGLNHPDYITIFAPKPFLITASTNDFFDITATRQTYADEQEIYNLLGLDENIDFLESNADHGLNQEKREKTVQWFRQWFYDDYSLISEPTLTTVPTDSLKVTTTGQVYTSFENEKTITDLTIELANSYAPTRQSFWTNNTKDSCLSMVKSLIRLDENYTESNAEIVDTIDRGNYIIEKIKLSEGNLVPVTGLLFTPKGITEKLPAVIYVDGRGKNTDAAAGGYIEKVFADSNKIVFAIDVRGFGETTDDPSANESKHGNNEHRNAVISLYIGKTLIGQRVEDIIKARKYLQTRSEVDPNQISIEGIGRASTSVLHAAAIDSEFSAVKVRDIDTSWMDIIENPTILNNMTHEIPSAMVYYDLPDLVNAISPRPVSYNPAAYVISDTTDTTTISIKNINNNVVLGQNYPNPFRNSTNIAYSIDQPANVSLVVYDLQGNIVKKLVDEYQAPDTYSLNIDQNSLQPGVYFYQLKINGKREASKKMIVLR